MANDTLLLVRLWLVLFPLAIGWVVVSPEWGLQVGTLACALQVLLVEVTGDA